MVYVMVGVQRGLLVNMLKIVKTHYQKARIMLNVIDIKKEKYKKREKKKKKIFIGFFSKVLPSR